MESTDKKPQGSGKTNKCLTNSKKKQKVFRATVTDILNQQLPYVKNYPSLETIPKK